MAHRGCVSGVGGAGWGALSLVAVPLPYLFIPPAKQGFCPTKSPVEPGRREETGGWDKGVEWGRRKRRRGSWRQAGPEARQMLATQEQQPGTQSFLLLAREGCELGSAVCRPRTGLSLGPTKDDMDLSVLHALGRSGYFS